MISVPGDIPAFTLSAVITDEAAIGVLNNKITGVGIYVNIPVKHLFKEAAGFPRLSTASGISPKTSELFHKNFENDTKIYKVFHCYTILYIAMEDRINPLINSPYLYLQRS